MWPFSRRGQTTPKAILSEAVRCRDERGHSTAATGGVSEKGQVTLTVPVGGTVVFSRLQVGVLRARLTAAAVWADRTFCR